MSSTGPVERIADTPSEKRPCWRNPWLLAVLALVALDAIFRFSPLTRRIPDPPPVVSRLPDFSLLEASGRPFDRASLAGTVHIVAFASPACPPPCPEVRAAMLDLQRVLAEQEPYERYGNDLRLMLVDAAAVAGVSPGVASLGWDWGLDQGRWTLLTGDPEALEDVAARGFGPALGARADGSSLARLAAAGRIAIVDGDGGVRGFYGIDREGRDEAFWRALRTLRDQRIRARGDGGGGAVR